MAVEHEVNPLADKAVTKSCHIVQGTSYGSIPPLWDSEMLDACVAVTDARKEKRHRRLGAEEELYVGFSVAANVCAASKLLRSGRLSGQATLATGLCDTGLKYWVSGHRG